MASPILVFIAEQKWFLDKKSLKIGKTNRTIPVYESEFGVAVYKKKSKPGKPDFRYWNKKDKAVGDLVFLWDIY